MVPWRLMQHKKITTFQYESQDYLKFKIEKGLALYFLLSGAGNFIFIFLAHFGFIEMVLPNYTYLEGVIDILVSVTVFLGLWRQKTWAYYTAIAYIFLASIYTLVEASMQPIEAWTTAYLSSVMIINVAVLCLLDCLLSSQIKVLRVMNLYMINIFLSLAVFFLIAYLFNAIVALFFVISFMYIKPLKLPFIRRICMCASRSGSRG